jgi:hypothetical protein
MDGGGHASGTRPAGGGPLDRALLPSTRRQLAVAGDWRGNSAESFECNACRLSSSACGLVSFDPPPARSETLYLLPAVRRLPFVGSMSRLKLYLQLLASLLAVSSSACSSGEVAQPSGPVQVADGVVCGKDVCAQGTVCCLQDSGPTCKATSTYPGLFGGPIDAGPDADICNAQPYLACDGPEDCDAGQVCCFESLLQTPHTTCEAPLDGTGTVCPYFTATVCHDDSECGSRPCLPDTQDPGAGGHFSVCQ